MIRFFGNGSCSRFLTLIAFCTANRCTLRRKMLWPIRMMVQQPMLSPDELERYARHIVLREVGGPGQAALKRARVIVIGAGGLGAPALLYLAAAGVGALGVIDDDTVALSNLQRQVIHGTEDVGAPKVASAAAAIRRLNPHVAVELHATRLVAANALALI